MSSTSSVPAPGASARPEPRRRRTQEERSAETRARVVAGATACVAELGFRGATMSAIADRAGVTWGAMQHQFGDKEAILDAVLETSLQEMERRISGTGAAPATARDRVERFTRGVRDLLAGRSYRAFLEIQLNRSRHPDSAPAEDWRRHVARALDRSWRAAFGDLGLSRRALDESQSFVFMVLAGMATESMLFPDYDRSQQHLDTLRDTLLRIFEED